jgi:hypothetical protein
MTSLLFFVIAISPTSWRPMNGGTLSLQSELGLKYFGSL